MSTKIRIIILSNIYVLQAPEIFSVAAVSNPVCNFALMVGTTDIPDWCFINAHGSDGKAYMTEAPSKENLNVFYDKSPISHVHKVYYTAANYEYLN